MTLKAGTAGRDRFPVKAMFLEGYPRWDPRSDVGVKLHPIRIMQDHEESDPLNTEKHRTYPYNAT